MIYSGPNKERAMPVEPRSLKELFLSALAVAPAERAAWLERECGQDTELRRRAELMLAAHDTPQSLLDRLAPAAGPPAGATVAFAAAGAERPSSAQREEAGTVVGGRYKLVEEIGEGGMGTVWMAQQTEPVKRLVAVKLIKPGMDSRQVLARFEAERQALALMDHPNIARVLDAGATAAGRPFFVMELVKGMPLTKYCDERRLTPKQRLELFVGVCQAVQHAHQKGIIHRDLKPTNVLVASYDGKPVPKVIDFGIAKATGQRLTEHTLVTGFGTVVGTLEYMSPEQAELNQLDIDTRSDIYSLGVLLYELLTGSTPLERNRLKETALLEVLRLIREEEPPRPSTRLSTTAELPAVAANRGLEPKKLSGVVRGELDWIVMKALDKDRSRRYESANSLAGDIERYLHQEPVQACPPSALYRLRKLVRRNKLLFTAALVVAVTLLAAVVGVTWKWLEAEQAERLARLREAEALVGQAHGTRLSRRPGQRFAALAALDKAAAIGRELKQPPAWFGPLRNEAIAALALPDIHITQEFGAFPPGSIRVELNDDFTLYVRTTDTGGCTIRRVADDREVCRLPELGEPADPGFGSGGMLAVRGRDHGRFQLWDVSGIQPALRFEEQNVFFWQFHPDRALLGLTRRDGGISIYDTATNTRLYRLAPTEIVRNLKLCLHPTGPFVAAFSYFHRVVQVRDLRTGAVVAPALPPWSGGNGICAWSPDGRTLLVPQGDGGKIQEYAFDPAAPALRPTRTLEGPIDKGGNGITFHPAGDRFVTRGWACRVNLFDAVSGQVLFSTHTLLTTAGEIVRFDRSGERLAAARVGTGNDRIGLWSFAGGREYRSLVHAGAPSVANHYNGPTVHPGGQLAAIGLPDGVAFFDLDTGSELAHIPSGNVCAQFDGAGNLLTNGFEGFFRWPVRPDPANPRRLLVGPPERLPFHPGDRMIAASGDGRVIAQSMWGGYGMGPFAGGWILHPNTPGPRRVSAGDATWACSVSPDGRWGAFGVTQVHHNYVEVFDAATGERVWRSPVENLDFCRFSPDGRWLLTNVDNGRAYATGTWQPGPQLGGGEPWDATADLAVLAQTNGIHRLVELATGRELARLEDPEQQGERQAVFTPDGTRLIVGAKNGLRVWDLRRIRAELAKLDLDWEALPYPPARAAKDTPPLSVTVNLGEIAPEVHCSQGDTARAGHNLRGAVAAYSRAIELAPKYSRAYCKRALAYSELGEHDKAIADYSRAIDLDPEGAGACNSLAWLLATVPEVKLRDARRAVELAKKATELAPQQGAFWNTLGAARYRAGDWKAAVAALNKSMALRQGGNASDWLFLAMACWRLDDHDAARRYYDQAVQWLENNNPEGPSAGTNLAELCRLRSEAADVLELTKK
jgi:serine/threonine protein kinase/tetratricopeptide (TPR) repeat protein